MATLQPTPTPYPTPPHTPPHTHRGGGGGVDGGGPGMLNHIYIYVHGKNRVYVSLQGGARNRVNVSLQMSKVRNQNKIQKDT